MTTRQFTMLDMVAPGLSVDDALELNQTTFGSVCYRDWVKFDGKRKQFMLSPAGREQYNFNKALDLHRANNTGNFGVRVHFPGQAGGVRGGVRGQGGLPAGAIAAERKDARKRAERREKERLEDLKREREAGQETKHALQASN